MTIATSPNILRAYEDLTAAAQQVNASRQEIKASVIDPSKKPAWEVVFMTELDKKETPPDIVAHYESQEAVLPSKILYYSLVDAAGQHPGMQTLRYKLDFLDNTELVAKSATGNDGNDNCSNAGKLKTVKCYADRITAALDSKQNEETDPAKKATYQSVSTIFATYLKNFEQMAKTYDSFAKIISGRSSRKLDFRLLP